MKTHEIYVKLKNGRSVTLQTKSKIDADSSNKGPEFMLSAIFQPQHWEFFTVKSIDCGAGEITIDIRDGSIESVCGLRKDQGIKIRNWDLSGTGPLVKLQNGEKYRLMEEV
jgi:hypothetical protein